MTGQPVDASQLMRLLEIERSVFFTEGLVEEKTRAIFCKKSRLNGSLITY